MSLAQCVRGLGSSRTAHAWEVGLNLSHTSVQLACYSYVHLCVYNLVSISRKQVLSTFMRRKGKIASFRQSSLTKKGYTVYRLRLGLITYLSHCLGIMKIGLLQISEVSRDP